MKTLIKGTRRWWLLALVLAVTLSHFWVTWSVSAWMEEGLDKDKSRIKRLEAVYVSELKLSAPPVAAPVAPSAKPQAATVAARKKRKPATADAASAPKVAESAPSQPEEQQIAKVDEPASAVEDKASAPLPTAAASSSETKPATGQAFVWPRATRVRYSLRGYFRGDVYGSAAVEWVREGMRYQVHVDAIIGPSFAPLGSWNLLSEGDITPEGLSPLRFEQVDRLLIKSSKPRTVTFEAEEVVLDSGSRIPRLPGMQDLASQLIQLSYQFILNPGALSTGNTIEMPLALPKRQEIMAYDVIGEETLNTSKMGSIPVVHVKPRRIRDDKGGVLPGDIWFAPTLQYLPVRILFRGKEDSYMDMQMDGPPQQVAAEGPSLPSSAPPY